MATSRLLKISTPLPNKILSNNLTVSSMVSRPTTLMCLNKVGLSADGRGGETKPVAVKAAGSTPAACVLETEKGVNLELVLAYFGDTLSHRRKYITKSRPWRFHIQMFVEKAIVDCRFFTLLAISGSLLGSVLCFVEGCFLIMVSYLQYLHPLSKMSHQQGHVDVVLQIIEAIDMFLMGTAMLVFAIALHAMFVGPHHSNPTLSKNNKFKTLPAWMQVESAMQAKSKMGHALIMILQIQVLDKSKSIAVSSGMDLAYFAAAIFLSSVSIFLLSRTNSKAPAPAHAER